MYLFRDIIELDGDLRVLFHIFMFSYLILMFCIGLLGHCTVESLPHPVVAHVKPFLQVWDDFVWNSLGQDKHVLTEDKLQQVGCVLPTDIDRRSQNLRHLYPDMGLQLGYSGFFNDQNNCDSSGAFVLQSELEDNTHETPQGSRRSWAHFVCICLRVYGRQ